MISLKVMGALLIVLCGLFMGLNRHLIQSRRIHMLEDMERFLNSILMGIGYSGYPLPDIIKNDDSDFAKSLIGHMQRGIELSDAWDMAASEFSCETDRAFVVGIFDETGTDICEGEIEKAKKNLEHCRRLWETARENRMRKGKSETVMPIYISVVIALIIL